MQKDKSYEHKYNQASWTENNTKSSADGIIKWFHLKSPSYYSLHNKLSSSAASKLTPWTSTIS